MSTWSPEGDTWEPGRSSSKEEADLWICWVPAKRQYLPAETRPSMYMALLACAKMCRVSCVPKLAHASPANLLSTIHSTSMLSTVARMGNTASRWVRPTWLPDHVLLLFHGGTPCLPQKNRVCRPPKPKTRIYHCVRNCKIISILIWIQKGFLHFGTEWLLNRWTPVRVRVHVSQLHHAGIQGCLLLSVLFWPASAWWLGARAAVLRVTRSTTGDRQVVWSRTRRC